MKDAVTIYLERFGPSLSSDVVEFLVTTHGIAPATARKRVSRADGDIRKLGYITFPRKARFVYLQKDFGSPFYWARLTEALLQTKSAYGYAIAALKQRNGFIPSWQFPIVCGAPLRQAKHLSPETIYTRLNEAGLLSKMSLPGLGECICLVQDAGYYDAWSADARARLLTEELLLAAVGDWARKLGIVSYDTVATRTPDSLPKVGTFAWDLTAPSYLGFMVKRAGEGKPKPGFFACDVFLDLVDEHGVQPFIRKCETLRQLRNVGSCMQVFVARRFTKGAHRLLKQHGIIAATPGSLFGEEVAAGLQQLTSVLRASAFASVDPAEFDELFRKFSKLEGALIQLRGTMFEFLSAEIARRTLSPNVRLNQTYRGKTGEYAEADVVSIREGDSVTFIECKGYSPYAEVPHDLVVQWLQKRVPRIYDAARSHPDWKNLTIRFALWSTGTLSPESLDLIKKTKASLKSTRYSIEVLLGEDIQKLCKATKDSSLLVTFKKHFTKGGRKSTTAELESSDEPQSAHSFF